jgi:hypothetical protein
MISIDWPCSMVVASKKCEAKVSQVLHRKGEWGRGRDLPKSRLDEISACCNENGLTLYQALSLRRTLLRSMPGGMRRMSKPNSQMGSSQGQQQVATLFEEAVESFIQYFAGDNHHGVYLTEKKQLEEMKAGTRPHGPTPDILFTSPVSINGQLVKWLDAKLYYASAMFADNTRIPNGKLKKRAQRYNGHFGGKGAFVFGQGFCADLENIVVNAMLLDATPLDMTPVNDFLDSTQRPWK